MKNILEVLRLSGQYLDEHGVPRAHREAEDLLAALLEVDRMKLFLDYERPLSESELAKYREWIRRRSKREPFGYIVEKVTFSSLTLKISPSVLVPRHETELMAEYLIQKLSECPADSLWDVGTGSGCLALAVKKRFPQMRVIASDLSPAALSIARENGKINDLDIECIEHDLRYPIDLEVDILISNPPYLSQVEYDAVEPEVKNEPIMALVGGASGLEMYVHLAILAERCLSSRGWGLVEIGTGQGEVVKNIFQEKGFTGHVLSDWAGHDRFFFLERDSKNRL